jgi:hypothetical protein
MINQAQIMMGGNYSDGKSRNDGTLSYANSKFGTGETLFSRIKKIQEYNLVGFLLLDL